MKLFLDSSILLESCLSQSPKYKAADALVNAPDACTSAHALAEAYATLSGDPRLKIHPADAARMVEDLARTLNARALGVDCLVGASLASSVFGEPRHWNCSSRRRGRSGPSAVRVLSGGLTIRLTGKAEQGIYRPCPHPRPSALYRLPCELGHHPESAGLVRSVVGGLLQLGETADSADGPGWKIGGNRSRHNHPVIPRRVVRRPGVGEGLCPPGTGAGQQHRPMLQIGGRFEGIPGSDGRFLDRQFQVGG